MSNLYGTLRGLNGNSKEFYDEIESVLDSYKGKISKEKTEMVLGHAKKFSQGEYKQSFTLDYAQQTQGADADLGAEDTRFTRVQRKQFETTTKAFASEFLGNMVSVMVGRKLNDNKTKADVSYASAKIKISKFTGLRKKNGQFIGAGSLVAIMNSYLPLYVANEMGRPAAGGMNKTFKYRTGQFASSVQTQELTTDGPAGSIFTRLIFQSNPYDTFGKDNKFKHYAHPSELILKAAKKFLNDTLHKSSVLRFSSPGSRMVVEGLGGAVDLSYTNQEL